MENTIFNIFVFCMFIVFGVLILGLLKWVIKYVKLCYTHILWRIKILMILPLSITLIIIWLIIIASLIYLLIRKIIKEENEDFEKRDY